MSLRRVVAVSLLDKIAELEEKLPQLVEALEQSRRELDLVREDSGRPGRPSAGKEKVGARKGAGDSARIAELQGKVVSLEKALKQAESASTDLGKKLETERAARGRAESSLADALKRLDTLVERLEGVETDLATLEEQTHGGS